MCLARGSIMQNVVASIYRTLYSVFLISYRWYFTLHCAEMNESENAYFMLLNPYKYYSIISIKMAYTHSHGVILIRPYTLHYIFTYFALLFHSSHLELDTIWLKAPSTFFNSYFISSSSVTCTETRSIDIFQSNASEVVIVWLYKFTFSTKRKTPSLFSVHFNSVEGFFFFFSSAARTNHMGYCEFPAFGANLSTSNCNLFNSRY